MFIEACFFFSPNKPVLPESDVTRRSEWGHRRSDPSSAVVNEAEILFLLALENTSRYTTCVGGWKKLLFLPPASFIIFSSCSSGWFSGWRISHIIPVHRNLIRHEWTILCSFSKHILCCSTFLTEMQETKADDQSNRMSRCVIWILFLCLSTMITVPKPGHKCLEFVIMQHDDQHNKPSVNGRASAMRLCLLQMRKVSSPWLHKAGVAQYQRPAGTIQGEACFQSLRTDDHPCPVQRSWRPLSPIRSDGHEG